MFCVTMYVVVKTSYTFYIKQIFTVQNIHTYLTSIIELEIQILLLRRSTSVLCKRVRERYCKVVEVKWNHIILLHVDFLLNSLFPKYFRLLNGKKVFFG